MMTIGPDHAIEKLFAAGVDPALLGDRPEDEGRGLLVEFRVLAHAVDLRGGWEDDPLPVAAGQANDAQVLLEVQLENGERSLDVRARRGDGDEGKDDVALLDVVLDPLLVDRDVPLDELETRMADRLPEPFGREIHAEDLPVRLGEDPLRQVVSDEAVDPENQD